MWYVYVHKCVYIYLYLFISIYFWTYTHILKSIYVQMGFKVFIFKRADFMNTEWFAMTERRLLFVYEKV